RPVTPDGRPILGPDPDVAGLYYATGHGRNGVLPAALTGEVIGDLLTKGETDVDLAPLSPTRSFPEIPEPDILTPDTWPPARFSMYATCAFCNAKLDGDGGPSGLGVGRRIAFDE